MTMILVPSFKGFMDTAYTIARLVPNALIGVDINRACRLVSRKKIDHVVVFMGAKKGRRQIGIKEAYSILRNYKISLNFVDGMKWNVPGMMLLKPDKALDVLVKACR